MALSTVHRAAPVLFVSAVATAVLLNSGVELGQVARWVGYELVCVVAPGVLAVLALLGAQRDGARLLALGWATGLTLEILAHLVLTRVGLRDVFPGWPLLVAAIAGPVAWRRRTELRRAAAGEGPRHSGAAIVAALACGAALVYLAAGWFTLHPLPEKVASVSYYTDAVFNISVTAEAMNHAPLKNPGVAGFPLPYHDWVFHHGAAAAEITGLDLSVVVLRMIPASLFVLLALGLAVAGRGLGRSPWAGALAAALLLAVGDLDPWQDTDLPWAGSLFDNLYQSPTFLLGLALFLPAVLLIGERLRGDDDQRSAVPAWALIVLLLVGCVGAKATTLPIVMGGLGIAGLWVLLGRRELLARVVLAGVLATVVFAVAYVAKYTGRGAGYELSPLTTFENMQGVAILSERLGGWVDAVSFVPGTVGLVGLILLGALAALGRGTLRVDQVFLAGMFLVGLGALFVLATIDGSQFWIVWYGVAAGALLAAQGLLRIARERRVLLLGAAAVLAFVSALDQPLDRADVRADINPAPGVQHYHPSGPNNRGLTSAVLEGLRWVRDHSDPDDVLVVNEHTRDAYFDSRYFYYSAFSERRVFLESWLYTSRAAEVGYEKVAEGKAQPFPGRLRDNNRLLETGDRAVARRLATEHGVRWLVEDRRFEARAPGFPRAGAKRFENPEIAIYEVPRP